MQDGPAAEAEHTCSPLRPILSRIGVSISDTCLPEFAVAANDATVTIDLGGTGCIHT
jgi:hypothetical protein